ncbi:STAS domain-containing protein [Polyangium sp. 6x1]|nr:STAS domain-containing protein [Polyangium sp. 6x1]
MMHCDPCVLRSEEGARLPLEQFGERLVPCEGCEIVQRSPEVRHLLDRHNELSRALRKAEQQTRRWENRCRELEEAAQEQDARTATLERIQETGMGELEEELRTKIALIEEQRRAIHLLSVPLLQVGPRALAIPLIGVLDDDRAARLTERLLQAINAMAIRFAVVDLTGVESLDQRTTAHLGRLFQAVRLLGGSVVITGVQGNVARAMIHEGIDLTGVRIERHLRDALRWCQQKEREGSSR